MEHLYFSFSIVFPLFFMMALGYFLKLAGILHDNFLIQLNNLCFKVFLSIMLFVNVYKSNFHESFSLKLVSYAVLCVILCFLTLFVLVPVFVKDKRKCGVIIQGIFRSNYILFGIPISASLFGEGNTSETAILIAFVIPLFNALSVIALERFHGTKTQPSRIFKQILKNPLILGSAAAFFFLLTDIKLPVLLEKTLTDISKVSTPLALMILGGSFSFSGLNHAIKPLVWSVLGKLVIVPSIFIPISILLGFRNRELAALFAMFASPTAVSSYTMAQTMGGDDKLAGQIVVLDSILSIFTIFVWVNLLTQMGFL